MITIARFRQLSFRTSLHGQLSNGSLPSISLNFRGKCSAMGCLRHRLLNTYRQKAAEISLRRIDVAGIAPELQGIAEFYTARNALDWLLDPAAKQDIEARLAAYGFDQNTISIEHPGARGSLPFRCVAEWRAASTAPVA